jgi:hypothetical protein
VYFPATPEAFDSNLSIQSIQSIQSIRLGFNYRLGDKGIDPEIFNIKQTGQSQPYRRRTEGIGRLYENSIQLYRAQSLRVFIKSHSVRWW